MNPPHHTGYAPMEVILETQPNQYNSMGKVYKDILASIGLDSPTSSQKVRGNRPEQDQVASLANTPIHNSVTSLMALGKHV